MLKKLSGLPLQHHQRSVLVVSSDAVMASTLGATVSTVKHCLPTFSTCFPWQDSNAKSGSNHFHTLLHLNEEVKFSIDEVVDWIRQQRARPMAPKITVVLGSIDHAGVRLEMHKKLYKAGVKWIIERPLNLRRLRYMIESTRIEYDFQRGRQQEHVSAHSSDMGVLLRRVKKVAKVDTNLLLLGETGVGKTRWAQRIHELSHRSAEPFVVVNCASYSPTLVESQMFGHAKGAFTGADNKQIGQFEYAGKGTIFLDEVDSLPLEIQAKLLHVVENREFCPIGELKPVKMRARIISAANRELDDLIEQKKFRSDLFFRLDAYEISIPPLRVRPEQIPELCQDFAEEFAQENQTESVTFDPKVIDAFQRYAWPGNLRELRNIVQRTAIDADQKLIHIEDLPKNLLDSIAQQNPKTSSTSPFIASDNLDYLQESGIDIAAFKQVRQLVNALTQHNYNRRKTAEELGVSRMTVYNLLKRYQLD